MQIKYTIKEVKPNIFAVIIKDDYDRAMTFCRVQEFYESPSKKFRGKNFSIWEYMKWYNDEYGRGFSYGADWGGFNIPFKTLKKCYVSELVSETPYDIAMYEIYLQVKALKTNKEAYIIGAESMEGITFTHEVCHGLWYVNSEYREQAKAILSMIDLEHIKIFKKNLIAMGYTDKVIDDEIQAYLMTNWDCARFIAGVPRDICEKYHKLFKNELEKYII